LEQASEYGGEEIRMQTGEFQSGQMGQTVNLVAYAFAGSNPASPNRRILKSGSCFLSDVDVIQACETL
jgi:hypothetical protein